MKEKPSLRRPLLLAGILLLTLAAFFAGGVMLSSAHAASPGKSGQAGKPGPTSSVKGLVQVNSVAGNTIQATIIKAPDFPHPVGAVTITTTASTVYTPDRSVVAPGKTLAVVGTVNHDGSISASLLSFYDPTSDNLSGTITKIAGTTITLQAKDETLTILVTSKTTFAKGLVDPQAHTKELQLASFKDLAVGETIQASGTLNKDGSLTATNIVIVPAGTDTKAPPDGGKK